MMQRVTIPGMLAVALVVGMSLQPAAASSNPCAERMVVDALVTNFNATEAAQSRALKMVAVSQMATLGRIDGKLFCHGVVLDSEGAVTPMTITMAHNPTGKIAWILRLDDAA
ncbi:hypothetical protein [Acidisphaera sp. L21]|uniref:hypothetical protein n=1 Tax=Acidisphaera sp. L21 TaxID=1641851 RepID=UPI00131E1FBA|nr:hypothetical protein [Acidisphaera sp. L21]